MAHIGEFNRRCTTLFFTLDNILQKSDLNSEKCGLSNILKIILLL